MTKATASSLQHSSLLLLKTVVVGGSVLPEVIVLLFLQLTFSYISVLEKKNILGIVQQFVAIW